MLSVNAVVAAELLELAGCATYAGEAILIVVGKKELKVELSCIGYLGGVCFDLHSLAYGVYASSYHSVRSSAFRNFNETHTACADSVDVLEVTKCGNIYICINYKS